MKKLLPLAGILVVIGLLAMLVMPTLAGPPGSWVTDFTLFNLSATNAATVQIMRYEQCVGACTPDSGTVVNLTHHDADPGNDNIIAAGGSGYYNPVLDASFPPDFAGSIVVQSNQPLAGTITLGNDQTGTGYASDAYSAVPNPSTSVNLPIIMAGLGVWNTRITVQNAGTNTANVTIDYIGSGAPANTVITGLPANMMAMVDQADLGISGFNGSAIVTSTEPLAVVVEEYKTTGGVLVTYNGVPSDDADTTLYMPGYIAWNVWGTDFTIVNTTASQANVSIEFKDSGTGNTFDFSGPVAANGSVYVNAYLPSPWFPPAGWTGTVPTANFYGAATVTSDQNIVIVYNIANSVAPGVGNNAMGYVAFPSTATNTSVVVPLTENHAGGGKWDTTFSVQSVGGPAAVLNMYYSGNLAPLCNPCTYTMGASEESHTFNQTLDGHIPEGFLGGVRIESTKEIVVIADQGNFYSDLYKNGDAAAGFVGFAAP